MTEINTNWDQDPYDDESVLGRITPVPVRITATEIENKAPEFGSGLTSLVPQLGVQPPVIILQRRPTRSKARIYNVTPSASNNNSAQGYGTITSPGAFTQIVAVTAPATGLYTLNWTVELEGTVSATDIDNVELVISGGATLFTHSLNEGAVGIYSQQPVTVFLTVGQIVKLLTVAAGTVGSIYSAQLSMTADSGLTPVYINSNPNALNQVNGTPVGFLLAYGQNVDWESQEPCYAICVGGSGSLAVIDEAYLPRGEKEEKNDT